MDIATVIGIILALLSIVGGLYLEGGNIGDISQYTAFIIVIGGTVGAVFVQFPMKVVLAGFKSFSMVMFDSKDKPNEVIGQIVEFANKARKEGLVSLEGDVKAVEDEFFRKAMMMAIDGSSLKEVQDTLELEIFYTDEHLGHLPKVWEACGGYAPTVGIIGAVMGLIQVMKNLQDIDAVGHGIAVAFVATVYGVFFANVIFLPAGTKVKNKIRESMIMKEMIITGVLMMIEGVNPRMIEDKLFNFFDDEVKALKKAS